MKLLDVRWFCGRDVVGIVRVETERDGIQYYIGAGKGLSAEADAQHIVDWGSWFPYPIGDKLFGVVPVLDEQYEQVGEMVDYLEAKDGE